MRRVMMLWLLFVFPVAAFTQSHEMVKRRIFRMSPFHFFDNTMQLSYECFSRKDTQRSVVYTGGTTLLVNQREELWGFHSEFQYRYYIVPSFILGKKQSGRVVLKGIYGAPLLGLQYMDRKYEEMEMNGCTEDTSMYRYYSFCPDSAKWGYWQHLYGSVNRHDQVPAVTVGVVIGAQWILFKALYVDIYLGGGIKYSFHRGEEQEYFRDYAYTGVLPKAGFQIGLGF